MTDSTIGIGVIGCGTIGEFMLNAWLPMMKNARLVAASDPNPDRTALFSSKYGIDTGYQDHAALLADPAVDAVLVLTPNHLHAPQTIEALAAGKHVLCQKPLALSVVEARSMIDAATASGRVLMAGFVKRFWPYFLALDELKKSGRLGTIRTVRSQFSHSGIGKYYKPASQWFADKAKSGGGPLFDLGVHHFDVMRWLVGSDVTETSAFTSASAAGELEDSAVVNFRFANGVLGQGFYSFTTIAPPGVTLERLEVYGTAGTAIVDLSHPGRVTLRLSLDGDTATGGGWIDLPVAEGAPAFGAMLQHFVDCLVEGRQPVTTGWDGLLSVGMAEAAYASEAAGTHLPVGSA